MGGTNRAGFTLASEVEIFVRVVETGSFSAAARDFGVLPSTVSRQITRLEERLGVRLLHRSTRAVSVTQVGNVYYEGSRRIVEETLQLEALVQDTGNDLRGAIRVAAPMIKEKTFIARLVSGFLAKNPQTHITMVPTADISSFVTQRIDIAICVGELDDHDWVARRVGDVVEYLVASPDYVEEFGMPSSVEELADHYCVVFSQTPEWPTPDGAYEPRARIVVHDAGLLLQFALSGAGIGLVNAATAQEDLAQGRLVRVLENKVEHTRPIWVLYPRDRLFPPTARAFVDHSIRYFADAAASRSASSATSGA